MTDERPFALGLTVYYICDTIVTTLFSGGPMGIVFHVRLGKGDEDLEEWWRSLPPGRRSQALKQALREHLERQPLEEIVRRVVREEIREALPPAEKGK
jgi:hypothetical protein